MKTKRLLQTFSREVVVPIVMALIVIQFVIQAFKIPSGSMEDSLLVGDFLLGLKFVYGLPVPFTDKKIFKLTEPKPGDVVIFRYPGDPPFPENNPQKYKFLANLFLLGNLYWDRSPAEGQSHLTWYSPKDFIKRCVAKSGQRLDFSKRELRRDGEIVPLATYGKYIPVTFPSSVRDEMHFRLPNPGETVGFDTLSLYEAAWIRSLAHQENPGKQVALVLELWKDSIIDNNYVLPFLNGYPELMEFCALTNIHCDPVVTPSAAYVSAKNVPFSQIRELYRSGFLRMTDDPRFALAGGRRTEINEFLMGYFLETINRNVMEQGRSEGHVYKIKARIEIDGQVSESYTVQKPCFFMMGDNRNNSSDGRFWGMVSLANVKAKAFIIYFSFENDDQSFTFTNPISWLTIPFKIRWTRIGRLID